MPSPSFLARVSRPPALLLAPGLLCLLIGTGCSSTPEASTPVTAAPATTAAPSTTRAPKATTSTTADADDDGTDTTDTTDASRTAGTAGTTDATAEDATTLPAGATAGLDDFDDNGEPDPTCGTQDFGGGLVLRIPCEITTQNEPPQGSVLVKDSLYRLPSPTSMADFENVSATLVTSRNEAGERVGIIFFNSDAMFATGSSTFDSDATGISLDATVKFIDKQYPGGSIQVRGHTDSTGTDAANQQLSEARANAVKAYLESHGVQATAVTAIGFGRSQPVAENQNPDGSPNEVGMNFNRRVEIAVTLPPGR